MADQLDALIDDIRQLSVQERRQPTIDDAREVGRLALCLANKKLPKQSQPLSSVLAVTLPAAAAARPLQRPAKPPSASAAYCTSFDKELNQRLKELRLCRAEAKEHASDVKAICNDVLSGLKERYPHTFDWCICNSGSYFDKRKVFSFDYVALSNFYRAKRGIAIPCRPSVLPSVCV